MLRLWLKSHLVFSTILPKENKKLIYISKKEHNLYRLCSLCFIFFFCRCHRDYPLFSKLANINAIYKLAIGNSFHFLKISLHFFDICDIIQWRECPVFSRVLKKSVNEKAVEKNMKKLAGSIIHCSPNLTGYQSFYLLF